MTKERLHPDTPRTGIQPKPLSVDHPPLNGIHHPVLQSLPSEKQRVTVCLPTVLIERLRNAVYWTGYRSLVALVAEALEEIVAQMEEVNGGPFPNVYPLSSEGAAMGNAPLSRPLRPLLLSQSIQTAN